MLINLLRGQIDFMTAVIQILAVLLIVFVVLPFHEWAHAFTALKLGDTSIRYRGRLTLNPMAHVDPVGAVALLLFGIGWAKPVPIDPRNFKRPKLYMGITALMGPVSNFVAALVGGLVFNALYRFAPNLFEEYWIGRIGGAKEFGFFVVLFLFIYIQINVTLAVFNFLPIPPLDGSKILFIFLPDRLVAKFYRYERFISMGLIAVLWLSAMNVPVFRYVGDGLNFIENTVTDFIIRLTGLPFGLSW